MTTKERRSRYEAGEFDGLIGRALRAAADRGDPRAVALVYEFWREIRKATRRRKELTYAAAEGRVYGPPPF